MYVVHNIMYISFDNPIQNIFDDKSETYKSGKKRKHKKV